MSILPTLEPLEALKQCQEAFARKAELLKSVWEPGSRKIAKDCGLVCLVALKIPGMEILKLRRAGLE